MTAMKRLTEFLVALFFLHALAFSQDESSFILHYVEDRFGRSFNVSIPHEHRLFDATPLPIDDQTYQGKLPTGIKEEENLCFFYKYEYDHDFYVDLNRDRKLQSGYPEIFHKEWDPNGFNYRYISYQIQNEKIPLHYKIGLRPFRYMGVGEPYYEFYFHSGWQGLIHVTGCKWMFAVVDNLDGVIGEGDLFILGAQGGKDWNLASSTAALRFSQRSLLYLKDGCYQLGFEFVPGASGSDLKVDLLKTECSLGRLEVLGESISRLVLYPEKGESAPLVILEDPDPVVEIPCGAYVKQRIYLHGNDHCGLLLSECHDRIVITPDHSVQLKRGPPLNNSAYVETRGNVLRWKYQILGMGDETYYEFTKPRGSRINVFNPVGGGGYYTFRSANSPIFSVSYDDVVIKSHEIRKPEEVKNQGEAPVLDYLKPNDSDQDMVRIMENVIPDLVLVRDKRISIDVSPLDWDFRSRDHEKEPVYEKIRVSDEIISYYHEHSPGYQFGLDRDTTTYSWRIPPSALGPFRVIASRELGDLGPKDGQPVVQEWSSAKSILQIAPWLILLPLLFLKENRNKHACMVFIPLVIVHTTVALLLSFTEGLIDVFENGLGIYIEIAGNVTLGLGGLYLLLPKIMKLTGGIILFAAFCIFVILGILGFAFTKGSSLPSAYNITFVMQVFAFVSLTFCLIASLTLAGIRTKKRSASKQKMTCFLRSLFFWMLVVSTLGAGICFFGLELIIPDLDPPYGFNWRVPLVGLIMGAGAGTLLFTLVCIVLAPSFIFPSYGARLKALYIQ